VNSTELRRADAALLDSANRPEDVGEAAWELPLERAEYGARRLVLVDVGPTDATVAWLGKRTSTGDSAGVEFHVAELVEADTEGEQRAAWKRTEDARRRLWLSEPADFDAEYPEPYPPRCERTRDGLRCALMAGHPGRCAYRGPDAPELPKPQPGRVRWNPARRMIAPRTFTNLLDEATDDATDAALMAAGPLWLLREHAGSKPNRWHYAAATVALERVKAEVTDEARNLLAEKVRVECVALLERVRESPEVEALNTALLTRLGQLEHPDLPRFENGAKNNPPAVWLWRVDKREPLLTGANPPWLWRTYFARLLAEGLWHAERRRAAKSRAAVVRTVYADELVALGTGGVQLSLDGLDDNTIRDRRGRVMARVTGIDARVTGIDANVIRKAIPALQTLPGHRVFSGLVRLGYEQVEADKRDPRRLDFVGGWEAFGREVGLTSKHHYRDAEKVLRLGQHVEWESRHGHRGGGWWTWTYKRGSRAGPGRLRVVLGDMLLPGYAVDMADGGGRARLAREARRLVPELRHEPPLSELGGGLEGPGLLLQRLFMLALVDGAEALARDGLVEIPEDEWHRMASDAGVPPARVPRVLDSWAAGDDNAPTLLERDGWRFTLAKPHELELLFLKAAGEERSKGRKRGAKRRQRKG
jgi:hypothetical protein